MKLLILVYTILFSFNSLHAEVENLPQAVKDGAQRLKDFGLNKNQLGLVYHYDENLLYLVSFNSADKLEVLKAYETSGGRGGVSNVLKSGGTAPGVHVIYRKQGENFAINQTFDASKYGYFETVVSPTTGLEFWQSDFVTTRILRMQGLEGAKNNNSVKRSILIHGTPSEGLIGYHESAGCIRMRNDEVIELFNTVPLNTLINVVSTTAQRRRVPVNLRIPFNESKEKPELRKLNLSRTPASTSSTQNTVNFLAGGDIIFHGALHVQAMVDGHGFESIFDKIQPILNQADLIYGNLEGPSAFQVAPGGVYTPGAGITYKTNENIYCPASEGKSYLFNFHPDSVRTLKSIGITVLSLANNHSFDRDRLGVDKTIALIDELKISGYGIRARNSSRPWSSQVLRNGIRFGFVGCTYGTNQGKPAPDQILYCFENGRANPTLINEVQSLKKLTDVVIFTPHWGNEYQFSVSEMQKSLAEEVLRAGARVIIGSHSHVLQPFKVTKNSRGEIENIVAFSMGNFATNQMPMDYKDTAKHERFFSQRVSALMALQFVKKNHGIEISEPRWIPTYMSPKHQQPDAQRRVIPAYSENYRKGGALRRALDDGNLIIERTLGIDADIVPLDELNNIFDTGFAL
jgi:Bacterial capsule synthesis protein PGA_cap/L,D-transpeptidase catalytic domain